MKSILLALSCLICLSAQADVRLAFVFGDGDVKTNSNFGVDDANHSGDSFAYATYLGYQTDQNITLDVGRAYYPGLDLFDIGDEVSLRSWEALFGYQLEYNLFFFEPKVGLGRWEFSFEEGQFLNPGPERRFEDSGTDFLYMLTAGMNLGPVFALSISYKDQDYDYGSATATVVGAHLKF